MMNKMSKGKRQALEAAGFQFGDAADFLELTEAERLLVDLRLGLADAIRNHRISAGLSQAQAAARIKTSQPRFAKIEKAAPDVSLDQMIRGLLAVGGKFTDWLANLPAANNHSRLAHR